ncbi:MAG TPA: DUF1328 domain-containing protein [Bacilli bacterium]
MIRGALLFFILAVIAGLYGFLGDANVIADLAKVLFVGFLILCGVFLVMGNRSNQPHEEELTWNKNLREYT